MSGMSFRPPEIKIHTHPLSLVQDEDRLRSVQRGELMHLALFFLAHCSGRGDIERAVLQAFALFGSDRDRWDIEKEYLRPLVAALSLPEARPWFARGVKSLREVEVVDVQGELHRIDRLVIGDTVHEVIDFKVGGREEGHRAQVELYQRLVEAVFHRVTKGYILYVDEPAVVTMP
jgi:hypothetical protein